MTAVTDRVAAGAAGVPTKRGACEYCGQVREVYMFALWTCGECLASIPAADDVEPVCSACKLPAAWRNGRWEHLEPGDGVICDIFRGAS